MNHLTVFGVFVIIRLSSIFLVSTWYVPDEYWQSLEVAHNFVYGYGYLTWEWTSGIRSYVYPLLISVVYKLLNLIGLDTAEMLIIFPRVLQAMLSAYSDYCFWKWCGKTRWSLFSMASSWFWFYTGSRTLLNTLETSLTTIALSQFPFHKVQSPDKALNSNFVWLVGLVCVVRPTAAIVWLPLCVYHLLTSQESVFRNIIGQYLPIGLLFLILSCGIDSWKHGSFIVTWWEFLKLNVFNSIGSFYGVQPWHWYLSQGFPALLGIHLLPFLFATVHILRHRKIYIDELWLLGTITFTITVYSFLSHKEFRFLMPLIPIALYVSSQYLSNWSRKASELMVWLVAGTILVANVVPAVYLGQFHQRGPLDVMSPLREITSRNPNVGLLFLTPCHSTPLYSHLHANVTARFLTCNPNLSNLDDYVDEADHFYNSPGAWLRNNYPPTKPLPTHIIAYDILIPHLSDILSRYKPIHRIYHTNIGYGDARIGRYITVHERVDF